MLFWSSAMQPHRFAAALGLLLALGARAGDGWRERARALEAQGKRDEAIDAWRKVIEAADWGRRYEAYKALAALGVRLSGPDVKVSAERDPASYRSSCTTFAEPSACGPGLYTCSMFKDHDDASDGRREVRASLAFSHELAPLERMARSRDPHAEGFTGQAVGSGRFVFNCLPREKCAPIECAGLQGDDERACRDRARAACDAELSKCATPPTVTPGDCAIVSAEPCGGRIGYVCNGKPGEYSHAVSIPPPSPPPLTEPIVSTGVIACCMGSVAKRSPDLPPASELMEAFRLGTREIAGRSWIFQSDIAEALIKLGNKAVMPELRRYLRSKDRETRVNAAWVLAKLGDDQGIDMVMAEALNKPTHPRMRRQQIGQDRYYAVRTLGMIGDRRAVPLLCKLVKERDLDYAAAYALSQIGDPSAIPVLTEAVNGARGQTRVSIAAALAELGGQRGAEALVEIMQDKQSNPFLREIAAEALGKAKVKWAVPALIEALHDPAIDARIGAARGLGEMGDQSAIPALTEALSDASQTATHGRPITLSDAARAAIEKIVGR
jgi:HEAT repeat protein